MTINTNGNSQNFTSRICRRFFFGPPRNAIQDPQPRKTDNRPPASILRRSHHIAGGQKPQLPARLKPIAIQNPPYQREHSNPTSSSADDKQSPKPRRSLRPPLSPKSSHSEKSSTLNKQITFYKEDQEDGDKKPFGKRMERSKTTHNLNA